MIFEILRHHSGGEGKWSQCFHSYQAALDELAALYGKPSSAWGPDLAVISDDREKYVRRVADGEPEERATYLITYWE